MADRFAAGEGCRAACGGIRNLLPAEMGRIPSSLPEVSQILFVSGGRKSNLLPTKSGRSGRYSNVIVIFVTMKQAVTPLRLGSDRISSLLVRYAIPSIIAMTSSSLYNIVDSIFIGHGVGPIAISGVALSMPLMNIASAFGSLIGIGAAALTSIRLGQGRREAAEGVGQCGVAQFFW